MCTHWLCADANAPPLLVTEEASNLLLVLAENMGHLLVANDINKQTETSERLKIIFTNLCTVYQNLDIRVCQFMDVSFGVGCFST